MSKTPSALSNAPDDAIPVDRWALEEARRIVLAVVGDQPVAVYLFGSRARGRARRFADIDVALDGHESAVPATLLADLMERLEESTIPYRVDLIDLADLPAPEAERVRTQGVAWKD